MKASHFTFGAIFLAVVNVAICAYAAQDATNSGKNKVQIQNNELDARDQGISKADVEVTRKIRQEVVGEKSFSSSAKNIKIITREGHVTLKGPVQNTTEKQKIEELAVKVAGKKHVNNEIEVINQ